MPQTHDNFKIITIVGSSKFKDEILELAQTLTLEGNLVLFNPLFHHSNEIAVPTEKGEMLRHMDMQRIDLSSMIIVVNKDGYIGTDTRNEILYANTTGKSVKYMFNEE